MDLIKLIASFEFVELVKVLLVLCVTSFCIRLILEALWNIRPFQGIVFHNYEGSRQETTSQEASREVSATEGDSSKSLKTKDLRA